MRALRAIAAGFCLLLLGCVTKSEVTRGAGATIAQAQLAPGLGGKYRVAVGAIIDKSSSNFEKSLTRQLERLNTLGAGPEKVQPAAVLGGIRDMLVTDLFGSNCFIVLERESLNDVLAEQEFSQSAKAGDTTRIPPKQLEG